MQREAGLIGVEGMSRAGKVRTCAHRHNGGVRAENLKIPLLRQWQHETRDP